MSKSWVCKQLAQKIQVGVEHEDEQDRSVCSSIYVFLHGTRKTFLLQVGLHLSTNTHKHITQCPPKNNGQCIQFPRPSPSSASGLGSVQRVRSALRLRAGSWPIRPLPDAGHGQAADGRSGGVRARLGRHGGLLWSRVSEGWPRVPS